MAVLIGIQEMRAGSIGNSPAKVSRPSPPRSETPRAMSNRLTIGSWLVLLVVSVALPAWAQSDPSGVPWDGLTPQEQAVLKPFAESWNQLEPGKQERLRRGAARWSTMNPEERREAREKFQRWRNLPPEQRERIRQRFQRFRQMPAEEREAMQRARQRFRDLPPEQRQELRERWRNMSPEERRQFRRERGLSPQVKPDHQRPRDGRRPHRPRP